MEKKLEPTILWLKTQVLLNGKKIETGPSAGCRALGFTPTPNDDEISEGVLSRQRALLKKACTLNPKPLNPHVSLGESRALGVRPCSQYLCPHGPSISSSSLLNLP